MLLESYDEPGPINVGVGVDLTINELAQLVAGIVGYTGEWTFDPSKPDGTPRKLLDVGRIAALGFEARITSGRGNRVDVSVVSRSRDRSPISRPTTATNPLRAVRAKIASVVWPGHGEVAPMACSTRDALPLSNVPLCIHNFVSTT